MSNKRGITNSIILARIDERTEIMKEQQEKMDYKIGKIFKQLNEHNVRLGILEEKDKKNVHIPQPQNSHKFKDWFIGWIFKRFI